jgi:NAD-dependent dihydropyrimidine dehydrogenase PreA subunit
MRSFQPSSYRQIRVGEFSVGMTGLDETFAALYEAGCEPKATTAELLLDSARQQNYIPATAEDVYAEALLREYRVFYQQQAAGCTCGTDYGTWRGQPRERIPWYPTLNAGRCDDCGACVRFCPNGVFATAEGDEICVVEPFHCQVGCNACVRVCQHEAITFPPREILEAFR